MANPLSEYGYSDRDYAAAVATAVAEAHARAILGEMVGIIDVMHNRVEDYTEYGAREPSLYGVATGKYGNRAQFDPWSGPATGTKMRGSVEANRMREAAFMAALNPKYAATLDPAVQAKLSLAKEAALLVGTGVARGYVKGATTFTGHEVKLSARMEAEHNRLGRLDAMRVGGTDFYGKGFNGALPTIDLEAVRLGSIPSLDQAAQSFIAAHGPVPAGRVDIPAPALPGPLSGLDGLDYSARPTENSITARGRPNDIPTVSTDGAFSTAIMPDLGLGHFGAGLDFSRVSPDVSGTAFGIGRNVSETAPSGHFADGIDILSGVREAAAREAKAVDTLDREASELTQAEPDFGGLDSPAGRPAENSISARGRTGPAPEVADYGDFANKSFSTPVAPDLAGALTNFGVDIFSPAAAEALGPQSAAPAPGVDVISAVREAWVDPPTTSIDTLVQESRQLEGQLRDLRDSQPTFSREIPDAPLEVDPSVDNYAHFNHIDFARPIGTRMIEFGDDHYGRFDIPLGQNVSFRGPMDEMGRPQAFPANEIDPLIGEFDNGARPSMDALRAASEDFRPGQQEDPFGIVDAHTFAAPQNSPSARSRTHSPDDLSITSPDYWAGVDLPAAPNFAGLDSPATRPTEDSISARGRTAPAPAEAGLPLMAADIYTAPETGFPVNPTSVYGGLPASFTPTTGTQPPEVSPYGFSTASMGAMGPTTRADFATGMVRDELSIPTAAVPVTSPGFWEGHEVVTSHPSEVVLPGGAPVPERTLDPIDWGQSAITTAQAPVGTGQHATVHAERLDNVHPGGPDLTGMALRGAVDLGYAAYDTATRAYDNITASWTGVTRAVEDAAATAGQTSTVAGFIGARAPDDIVIPDMPAAPSTRHGYAPADQAERQAAAAQVAQAERTLANARAAGERALATYGTTLALDSPRERNAAGVAAARAAGTFGKLSRDDLAAIARAERELAAAKARQAAIRVAPPPPPRPVAPPPRAIVAPVATPVRAPAVREEPVSYRNASPSTVGYGGSFTSMGGRTVDTIGGHWNRGGGYGFVAADGTYYAAGGDFHADGKANYNDRLSGNWSPGLYDPSYEAGYSAGYSGGGQEGGGGGGGGGYDGPGGGFSGSSEQDRQNDGDTYR